MRLTWQVYRVLCTDLKCLPVLEHDETTVDQRSSKQLAFLVPIRSYCAI